MNWISVKQRLPDTFNLTIDDEYGIFKTSKQHLIATKNGGFYLGYLELRKTLHSDHWIPTWNVSSIQDEGIDSDGVTIDNVIAWMEIPEL